MSRHTTDELLQILHSIENAEELDEAVTLNVDADKGLTFSEYITEQTEQAALPAGDLIRRAHIQRNYGYQILNGSRRPGRDKVIAMCLALSLPLEEVQRALTIAEENTLYPRRRRDAILIFGIHRHLFVEEVNQLLFEMQEPILQ